MLDYIIIGQGLAGTLLAYFLHREGSSLILADEPSLSASSRIASGIYNPITGKRLALSWNAPVIIPFAEKVYSELEAGSGERFLYLKPILRIFQNEDEAGIWRKKSVMEEFARWGEAWNDRLPYLHSDYGAVRIMGGWLDTGKFLACMRRYFERENILLERKFSFEDLEIHDEGVRWGEYSAKRIIFCDGYRILENPFFRGLPYQPSKGELVFFRPDGLPDDSILMGNKIHIVPRGEHLFLAGSTYSWENLDDTVSAEARDYLAQKLEEFLKVPFEIVEQRAGVRLSVTDQRPLVGFRRDMPQVGLINGFGAKGVMYAPYCAWRLMRNACYGEPLDAEISLGRFHA